MYLITLNVEISLFGVENILEELGQYYGCG